MRLDGSVPQKLRSRLVATFQSDENCRAFLTTNAGATGLNLQPAMEDGSAFVPWIGGDLDDILCEQFERTTITTDYAPGTVQEVIQHDGSIFRLRKVDESYDANNRVAAMNYSQEHHAQGEVVTGLLYVDPQPQELHGYLHTVDALFSRLAERELCPESAVLAKINASLR